MAEIFFHRLCVGVLGYAPMAVLLITYKCNADPPKAATAFYEALGSYAWVKLYGSNYAITAVEPAR